MITRRASRPFYVYLSSRFSDRPRMRRWKTKLERAGIQVTSRWVTARDDKGYPGAMKDPDIWKKANRDLADIRMADVVVVWSDKPLHGQGHGGRHVELGYALGMGMSIILVGERENVFHWLPTITVIQEEILLETLLMFEIGLRLR